GPRSVSRSLAETVDAVFPSLYTFYRREDSDGWVTYAKANLEQARRYQKPIYAFLCPRYQNTFQDIEADFWRLQLQTCRELADGCVIWDWTGLGKPGEPALRDRPFWKPTLEAHLQAQ